MCIRPLIVENQYADVYYQLLSVIISEKVQNKIKMFSLLCNKLKGCYVV